MTYKFNEYSPEYSIDFGTLKKNFMSKIFVKFIFSVLNKKKYNSAEDFFMENKDFVTFIRLYSGITISKYNSIIFKHFNGGMTEDDYQKIKKSILELTNQKRKFDEKNIVEQQVDGVKYVTYTNPNSEYNFINREDGTMKDQLTKKQEDDESYNTTNEENNAQAMFRDLSQHHNEVVNFVPIKDLKPSVLSEKQQILLVNALNYVNDHGLNIDKTKIDLDKNLIIDENNMIVKIDIDNKKTQEGNQISGHQKVFNTNMTKNVIGNDPTGIGGDNNE